MTGYIKHDTPYCSRQHNTQEKAKEMAETFFKKKKLSKEKFDIFVYKDKIY